MAERALTAEAAPREDRAARTAPRPAPRRRGRRRLPRGPRGHHGFLLVAAELSGPTSRFGADATIGTLSMGWDAQWYWVVGSAGYPAHLPVDATGAVTQNAWAFMPVYPALTRALSVVFAETTPRRRCPRHRRRVRGLPRLLPPPP
jgi:hypothetical protein